jgi:Tfp pilus assembly protein PilN
MPRLSLDFASEQRDLTAWNPALGLALLLAGALLFGIVAWDSRSLADEKINLQDRLDTLTRRTQQLHNHEPIPAGLITQIEQANTVYALLQTPWEEIFTALETVLGKAPNDIALLSVKADAAKQELTLSGEARDFAALSAFTAALSAVSIFQNVSLADDKLSTGSPPVVVTFDLHLTWRGKAPSR